MSLLTVYSKKLALTTHITLLVRFGDGEDGRIVRIFRPLIHDDWPSVFHAVTT